MDKKKVIILIIAIAVSAAFVSGLFVYNYTLYQQHGNEIRIDEGANYDDLTQYLRLGDLQRLIEENYYKDVEESTLVTGALKGVVDSLEDPYSMYYTEEEYAAYVELLGGNTVGIGATVTSLTKDSGFLEVTNVYGGSPAQETGILVGDIITGVNGLGIGHLDYDGAVAMISGPTGSSVTLTVQTGNEVRNVELTRTEMNIPFVGYSMLDDRVGYLVISEFQGNCVEDFKEDLITLKEEEGAQGIVIDLRENMGGNTNYATEILDEIMPEGLLTYSVDKNDEKNEIFSDASFDDIPIAVLVNDNTAGASEIFAAAIKDRQRGSVIGTQTYGKAVSQAVQEMPYGSGGGVKLTTATYFSPNGEEINGVGVTPDQVVEMQEGVEVKTQEDDAQLQAALANVLQAIGG